MTTKSSGFTLVELLVVVAIIGILSAVGIVSYSGYTKSAKVSSTKSIMQQIALMQTEYLSNVGGYYVTTVGATCEPTAATSENIERELFPKGEDGDGAIVGEDVITTENGFEMCIVSSGGGYTLIANNGAEPADGGCTLTLTQSGILNDDDC